MSKAVQRKYEGKLVSVPIENSIDCLFVNLLGPQVKTKDQSQYILVVVTNTTNTGYSRFTWLSSLRDCKSQHIIKALETIVICS